MEIASPQTYVLASSSPRKDIAVGAGDGGVVGTNVGIGLKVGAGEGTDEAVGSGEMVGGIVPQ